MSLEKGLIGTCAPSKYYSYLQSGLPVIAVVETDLYFANDICTNNVGNSVNVGDGENLAKIILDMAGNKDKLCTMAENAEKLYDKMYSINIGTEKYREMFRRILR